MAAQPSESQKMKTQQIISELKELLNKPEVINGFKTQADCLAWSNKVASLLQVTKEHHAFFMERLNVLNVSGLSGDLYASTFRILVSIANQGLWELEHNMPADIEIDTSTKPEKEWYEKPHGIILLTVISGLILAYLVYLFGWNGPKDNMKQTQEQTRSTTPDSNIPKKIPSSPPVPKK